MTAPKSNGNAQAATTTNRIDCTNREGNNGRSALQRLVGPYLSVPSNSP